MNLRCLIVDDEPNAVNLLEMFILQNTGWQLLAKCYDAMEALAFLKSNSADLVFLDINMPQLSGMELASLLPQETRIVFTTAYSEFAADSYSFQTIDYLLKPITLKRFYTAMQKIEAHFEMSQPGTKASIAPLPQSPSDEYFFIKSGRLLHYPPPSSGCTTPISSIFPAWTRSGTIISSSGANKSPSVRNSRIIL
jgi:two-component system LytT family response regulator